MRLIDYSAPTPAENLALEEVLLERVETGAAPDTLRIWESTVPFVVLGTGQVLAAEVREEACAADNIPILRRCSAGGCVLQGPGCLNFSLALSYAAFPQAASLHESYCWVLTELARAFRLQGSHLIHEGTCDLAIDGLKVSGNAQRRKRRAMLHHGTLLYRPDVTAISLYLREPADRPGYRGHREHDAFVGHIPMAREKVWAAVVEAFEPSSEPVPATQEELEAMRRLAVEKYQTRAWTYRR